MPASFDGLLPVDAKYFSLVETNYAYNSHWDITWSFSYALTGTEHGICTYLVGDTSGNTVFPGHYMGYIGPLSSIGPLAVAFDSTGLFALSSHPSGGLARSEIRPNSLVIRDFTGDVIYNNELSALDTNFSISEDDKTFKTIRIRFANIGKKISIDYRYNDSDNYTTLLNLSNLPINTDVYTTLYPGFSFTSPVSSSSISPSKIWIKNFNTQGNINSPTYQSTVFTPITSTFLTSYTTISGISATL